jgi:hypothetical protein
MSATTTEVTPAADEAGLREMLAAAGRACCCPARPVVVAIIPPAAGRPDATDLLLCGHHYRACRDALEAAGAAVRDSRPRPEIRHDPSDELLASRSLLTNPKEERNTR